MEVDFSVFADTKFDSHARITGRDSLEALGVENFFKDRSRFEVTVSSLAAYPHDPAACLVFMTPTAFAFFLPPFMKIALNEYRQADAIPEAIVGRLLEMAEGRDPERLSALLSSYSAAQVKAVADFLRAITSVRLNDQLRP